MNHQDIISQKIEYLNGNRPKDLSDETLELVNSDPELASEIQFIDEIWNHPHLDTVNKPSAQMQARFYQMLSHAQASDVLHKETKLPVKESLLIKLGFFKPAFQVLLLVAVFGFGWSFKSEQLTVQKQQSALLENKIDTLNVMVALSMLKKESAAERLAGVDYAKNVKLDDKQLTESLLTLLNSDRSSAVRLSVVDLLANRKPETEMVDKIVNSLAQQSNPIVQIALVELLQNTTNLSQSQLTKIYENQSLDSEVMKLLLQRFSSSELSI